jgi:hypothetical protein
MKTPGLRHYQSKDHTSVSALCTFARCPRRYFYGQGCRLCRMEVGLALDFGGAIHLGLPWCHEGDVDGAVEVFESRWEHRLGDEKRSSERARAMFADFAFSHSGSRGLYDIVDPVEVGWKPTRISGRVHGDNELEFELDLGLGGGRPLVGLIDALGRHRDTGRLWLVEYKTSSELSSRFIASFNLAPQTLVYTMAARRLGLDVEGVIYEGLLVHKTRCETLALPVSVPAWLDKVGEEWVRETFFRLRDSEVREEWPQDISGCGPYPQFGQCGYQCEFEPLCMVEDWPSLRTMYEERSDET